MTTPPRKRMPAKSAKAAAAAPTKAAAKKTAAKAPARSTAAAKKTPAKKAAAAKSASAVKAAPAKKAPATAPRKAAAKTASAPVRKTATAKSAAEAAPSLTKPAATPATAAVAATKVAPSQPALTPAPPGAILSPDGWYRWENDTWVQNSEPATPAATAPAPPSAGAQPPTALGYPPAATPRTKNWFARHKALTISTAVVLVLIGIIAGAASSGGNGRTATNPTGLTASTSSPSAPTSDDAVDTPTPSTPETTAPEAIGQTLELSDADGDSGEVTVTSLTVHRTGTGEFAEQPKNGYYIVAKVSASVSAGSLDFNPFDFSVQESDGTTFQYASGNSIGSGYDDGDTLDAQSLATGQKTTGLIVFDVGSPHGTIVYKPFETVIGGWTF